MATEGYKRKLTAILHADVVGYSRLMGDDEEASNVNPKLTPCDNAILTP
jgi:class 3 adenylate cyclase